jgi:proteasome lid subunit RPN8/RPN11
MALQKMREIIEVLLKKGEELDTRLDELKNLKEMKMDETMSYYTHATDDWQRYEKQCRITQLEYHIRHLKLRIEELTAKREDLRECV